MKNKNKYNYISIVKYKNNIVYKSDLFFFFSILTSHYIYYIWSILFYCFIFIFVFQFCIYCYSFILFNLKKAKKHTKNTQKKPKNQHFISFFRFSFSFSLDPCRKRDERGKKQEGKGKKEKPHPPKRKTTLIWTTYLSLFFSKKQCDTNVTKPLAFDIFFCIFFVTEM